MEPTVIYSNIEAFEGTVNGTKTFDLTLYSRKIIIQNDSGSSDLKFYPQGIDSGNSITLRPTESLTLNRFRSNAITVEGNNIPYRVWVIG